MSIIFYKSKPFILVIVGDIRYREYNKSLSYSNLKIKYKYEQ